MILHLTLYSFASHVEIGSFTDIQHFHKTMEFCISETLYDSITVILKKSNEISKYQSMFKTQPFQKDNSAIFNIAKKHLSLAQIKNCCLPLFSGLQQFFSSFHGIIRACRDCGAYPYPLRVCAAFHADRRGSCLDSRLFQV